MTTSGNLLAGLRSGDWLDAQTFPPIRWVLPGLLPEGLSLLIGGPKLGKSALSLDVALAVAGGDRALGALATGEPRPVLLLALEDGDRRLQERARRMLEGRPIPKRFQYMTKVAPGLVRETISEWLDSVADAEPLVILDTLGKVMPPTSPGESAYGRDYRVTGSLKRIADDCPGMSLLVLHHDRKAESADFVEGVSGTNGIAGAADSILLLSRSRNESAGVLRVTGRDVAECDYAMTVDAGRWRLSGDGLAAAAAAAETARLAGSLGDLSASILRYVADHPGGVRAADTAEAVGTDPDTAGKYLRRLKSAGRISKAERGRFVPLSGLSEVSGPEGLSDTSDASDSERCSLCGRVNIDAHRSLYCLDCCPGCVPTGDAA